MGPAKPGKETHLGCTSGMQLGSEPHPVITTQMSSCVKSFLTLMRTLVFNPTLTHVPKSAVQSPTSGKGGTFPTCLQEELLRSRSGHFVHVVHTMCKLVVSAATPNSLLPWTICWCRPFYFLAGQAQRFLLRFHVNPRFLVMLSKTPTAMMSVMRH